MLKKKRWLIVGLTFLLVGCGIDQKAGTGDTKEKQQSTGYEVPVVDCYDSMDIAIVEEINQDAKTITLINTTVSKTYTLSYDGTTCFYDRNMQSLSAKQIKTGDVVQVTFYKPKKRLNTLQIYQDSWIYENVTGFEIAESGKIIEIYGEKYRFSDNSIVIIPNGSANLMDINSTDTISVTGVDHDVCSVTVTKGHGYLRLSNDTMVIGGWIEVGNSIIRPISEDMLLLVPEGEYDVNVSLGSASLKQRVSIKRDQETVFDCASFEPEEILYGNILFTVDPETTSVYIDGSKVDISAPVELAYGIHQMIARANGYETLSKYIKVGSENASLSILLEKALDDSEEKETEADTNEEKQEKPEETKESTESGNENTTTGQGSDNSQSQNQGTQNGETTENSGENQGEQNGQTSETATDPAITDTTATTSYRVYIDTPIDAEVYLDGVYVGITPVNFRKVAGTHTLTLRRTGFVTRSFTIQIDEEEKDISYSFSELEKSTE